MAVGDNTNSGSAVAGVITRILKKSKFLESKFQTGNRRSILEFGISLFGI
jgi:hypothetical protein